MPLPLIGLTKISLTKPILTTHLSWNRLCGFYPWNVLKHTHHEQNKIQTVTVNLTQCDCLYPCQFHITSLFHGAPCSQINYSKLCRLRQISLGKLKAAKKLCIGWKLSVPGLWTLNIFAYDIYLRWGTLTKPDREPLFGHGNTFDRGLPVVCIRWRISTVKAFLILLWLKDLTWSKPLTQYISRAESC